MADQASGKSAEQLKVERTTAKRLFSRLANRIRRTYADMSEEELKESYSKLTAEAKKVIDANDDLEAAIIADLEAELDAGEDAALTVEQEAEMERTAKECELKLRETKRLIQETLWASFGKVEISTALQVAEGECERVDAVQPNISQEAYEFKLNHLKELAKTAKEAYSRWSQWVPPDAKQGCQSRLRELDLHIPRLISKTADVIQARKEEDAERQIWTPTPSYSQPSIPAIRLKPTALPKFTGNKRDFHRWRKDWEALQRQGEPTGSREVKKVQLLDSLDDKVTRDLRLTTYNTADDIFRVLSNRYGNQTSIAIEIVEELQRMPAVRSHQPKKIVELIQAVEKALQDLTDLGDTGAIKNPLVTKSIESKLPETLKKEWLVYVADKRNAVAPENRFDSLLAFLKEQESIYEQLEQLREEEPRMEQRHGRTKATKTSGDHAGCVVCGDPKHRTKLYFCRQFRGLMLGEKNAAVRRLGACKECLEVHDDCSSCKPGFLCKNKDCKDRSTPMHHYYLCPNFEMKKSNAIQKRSRIDPEEERGRRKYTEEQEEFFSKLSPELAWQCRDVFFNAASRVVRSVKDKTGLLEGNGLQELPVIMMLLEVTANAGQKIGTLIDLASDTNYITHRAASRLNLRSEEIKLVVHGVAGMKVHVETKRYLLKIRVKTPKGTLRPHNLVCYGLDSIADIHRHVTPKQLQKFFPDVPLEEVVRPKEINLLISHREGRLVPQTVKAVGDLVLWDGPLGKTVGGTHPKLFEGLSMSAHQSKTHFARSMRAAAVKYEELINRAPEQPPPSNQITTQAKESKTSATKRDFLEWWRWDSIGAACEPKCGGCRCGNCQPGGKEITLAEERELEVVREGLTYVTEDRHSEEPHWHARYPWLEDPATLPNNKRTVEATFLRTEKQLSKEPEWKAAYAAQVHDMVNRRAAIKLSNNVITSWTGPVWYVSHLIAPNPHSVTTPVRLVWNSSQKCRGVSLNDLLMKGPDVLNPIRAVLLRFRGGRYAALGDIRKMYNSVWLEDTEMHLHRFLWRDSEEEELGEYAITRVNIGDKPAGCIAQLAMRETANLPRFTHLQEEKQVLHQDSYVDDIVTSHDNLDRLRTITANVEQILKAGGFELKPWVFSGQSGRKEFSNRMEEKATGTIILPNQMRDNDNKALGLGYLVEEDKLHVMIGINFSKRRKKMRLGQDLLEQIRAQTPNPLTRRELLSQVSGLYDPLGLVTPVKQKGTILVRRAFREDAIKLLQEYVRLDEIKFTRALTPPCVAGKPSAITFLDGSKHTYGAVMYLRWNSDKGPIIRLVESKAKLTPLDQRGEAGKASAQDLDECSEWQEGPKFLSLPIDEWSMHSAKDLAAAARDSINKLQKKAFVAVLTRSQEKTQNSISTQVRVTGRTKRNKGDHLQARPSKT
ncbi:uncharacterized protein LOC131988465 [Centropristis striata]|uniref:uncharacterized protein LOC131988465 n=1 Tax=Centropristis striata TaxID=184440 RepID=UPI0027DF8F8E|nr:uncharacterized protein LOC131988465 [Centropristis striata]